MKIIYESLIILAMIVVNGFLAMAEIAIVSARKVRLSLKAEEGEKAYQRALEIANAPNRFLSTVQIGITLVGILAGAFGSATIAEALEDVLVGWNLAPHISEAISVAVVVILITYLSLVIGELVPKQIALLNPERIAAMASKPMDVASHITSPLVALLSVSSDFVLRLLGLRIGSEPEVSEEEVKLLIDHGTKLGVFDPIEDTIVDRVFRLGDQRIESLVTPRTEVVWLDMNEPIETSIEKIKRVNFSHFPVIQGNMDNLLGFVKATDLLKQSLESGTIDIRAGLLKPLYVPENVPVFNVLEKMRETGYEIAFVIDEYGGVSGLVNLRDVLEALVGDMPQVEEMHDPDIVYREDGTMLLDGMIPIQQFYDLLKLNKYTEEESNKYQTLAGFVTYLFGHIPRSGESVYWQDVQIEVVDMDGLRIDKLLVSIHPQE